MKFFHIPINGGLLPFSRAREGKVEEGPVLLVQLIFHATIINSNNVTFQNGAIMEKLNSHRSIAASDDHSDLISFEHTVQRLIKTHGFDKVDQHFAQATINQHENRFEEKLKIKKGNSKFDRKGFFGDHVSLWEGIDGTVFRCDEYPMSWDQLLKRVQAYQTLGLDGYITGQSIHLPGMTFGIVCFEKGNYTTQPGI